MRHLIVQMGVELTQAPLKHVDLGVHFSDAAEIEVVVARHREDHFLDLLGVVIEVYPRTRLFLVLVTQFAVSAVGLLRQNKSL